MEEKCDTNLALEDCSCPPLREKKVRSSASVRARARASGQVREWQHKAEGTVSRVQSSDVLLL